MKNDVLGSFIIDMRLPSMNDMTAANRAGEHVGAKMKKETESDISKYIMLAVAHKTLSPVKVPVEVWIEWHEQNKRRDADNIESGIKFILDALQKSGILINDSRRWVKQLHHLIVDDKKTFVKVWLTKSNTE